MITAGRLEVGDVGVMMILLVVGVEDRAEVVLEAALEVLDELLLESEEEEALVDDDNEVGKDVKGVEDEVVGVTGSGIIGVNTIIGDEDDGNVGLD